MPAPKPKPKAKGGGAFGGIAVGLGGTGLLLASQLGTEAIRAGAAVGAGAIGADLIKDLAKNPLALAAIAGVLGLVLLK